MIFDMKTDEKEAKSARNKTIKLTQEEVTHYGGKVVVLRDSATLEEVINRTICGDYFKIASFLPDATVDLLVLDPPYNLRKSFKGTSFKKTSEEEYTEYIESILEKVVHCLKPTASVYICGDYNSSTSIHLAAKKYLKVLNRITWQREKGRGAKTNWKNCTEDIWFCAMSKNYKFRVDRVKEIRKVIAPYKEEGEPKDWIETKEGNFRLTHPSNIWTDLTIPYWSMGENTEHPTQKPEKLLAKIILASSDEGDVILDPFLGSGTTSVVAKKLNRNYIGIELDHGYAAVAEKRLEKAEKDKSIQGYEDGVFWERNTLSVRNKLRKNENELTIW